MTGTTDAGHIESETATPRPCPICDGVAGFDPLNPREMMMGTRDTFEYRLCRACGSVSTDYPPSAVDLSKYYDETYHSFHPDSGNRLLETVRRRRDASYFNTFAPVGAILQRLRHDQLLSELSRVGVRREHRILDVGCGAGRLVDRLAAIGFGSVKGVDPFLDATTTTRNGVTLEKAYLSDIAGIFDVIMFHHSLEHMSDPRGELAEASARLTPDGLCVVRLPTPSSEAFRIYGEAWVQIDAPRHFALPSREGMRLLAEDAGLRLHEMIDDSVGFGFFGSEMVQKDIPFGVGAPDYLDPVAIFSKSEMQSFSNRAEACNRSGTGDQFLAILRIAK